MPTNQLILKRLRAGGERITPIRSALISILAKTHEPMSPQDILVALKKRGLPANKTTVYRQLETLEQYSIIQAVRFTDRTKRYELVGESGHHHHLVCVNCGRIEDVSFPTDLETQEKTIWQKHKFKVLQHSLEFFGMCKKCQNKK